MTMNKTERTGVWTSLPQTVSAEAKFIAEAFRHLPAPPPPPITRDEWQVRNDSATALLRDNGALQSFLNLRAAKRRAVVIDNAAHTLFEPDGYDASRDNRIVLHIHGGGYVGGAAENEAPIATPVAAALGCPVLSISYPLWWEAPPPADVERIVAVYREIAQHRPPSTIALMGVSAGGGLALRSALRLAELGDPLPAAMVLATPWTDVSGAGDTFTTLMPYDVLESTSVDAIRSILGARVDLRSPDYSPIYARYPSHLPPTIIATGTRDSLLSDCARLQRKLTDAGVVNDLRVFEGMPHGFMGFRMPETDACISDISRFLEHHLRRR
ncbi:MAG: alpha/beta hydrolase [Paraburkholderia sp.]|jgi:acetyl esterase/lipase|uniref:alpha/beta hydrolase n=1 Tax=Burkholderiaceae TaxID=119060 RepID=UPI0010F76E27|nr:alpha/beta hydrolase [Burkholderia sp. 4M9327F10]